MPLKEPLVVKVTDTEPQPLADWEVLLLGEMVPDREVQPELEMVGEVVALTLLLLEGLCVPLTVVLTVNEPDTDPQALADCDGLLLGEMVPD